MRPTTVRVSTDHGSPSRRRCSFAKSPVSKKKPEMVDESIVANEPNKTDQTLKSTPNKE